MVPPSLNNLGDIPPGHHPSGQIPFLAHPSGVFSVPIMATLTLPNMTLGILVWYMDPLANTPPSQLKPYTALTPVQPVAMTPPFASVPQPPQHEPTPLVKASGEGGKACKKAPKEKAAHITPAPPKTPKCTTPCALRDVDGRATHHCLELSRIKPMVNIMFPESEVPNVHLTLPTSAKKLKTTHTNRPCALFDIHGHYTHLCPHLKDYHTSLEVVHQYKVERNESTYPLFACYDSEKPKDTSPPINIPPPDVEMMESSAIILYLSSSMRSMVEDHSGASPSISL